MSYILDALRKAEQERHSDRASTLTPSLPPPAEPAQNWFWYGLVALALVVNAALLAFFLGHPQSISPTPPSLSSASSASSASPTPQAQASAPTAHPIPATPSPPSQSAPRRSSETPRPPSPAARMESSPAIATAATPAPTAETLPTSVQRELPTLHLDIHVHSRDARKRFAVINGRRYREGEQLSEGPLLEAVTTTGVTLRYGARRFQLVLNH